MYPAQGPLSESQHRVVNFAQAAATKGKKVPDGIFEKLEKIIKEQGYHYKAEQHQQVVDWLHQALQRGAKSAHNWTKTIPGRNSPWILT